MPALLVLIVAIGAATPALAQSSTLAMSLQPAEVHLGSASAGSASAASATTVVTVANQDLLRARIVTLSSSGPLTASFEPTTLVLPPGGSAQAEATVTDGGQPAATYDITIAATETQGSATASAALKVVVHRAPASNGNSNGNGTTTNGTNTNTTARTTNSTGTTNTTNATEGDGTRGNATLPPPSPTPGPSPEPSPQPGPTPSPEGPFRFVPATLNVSLAPGASTSARIVVQPTDPAQGAQARLSVLPPPGWSMVIEPAEIDVPAGATGAFEVRIRADEGARDDDVRVVDASGVELPIRLRLSTVADPPLPDPLPKPGDEPDRVAGSPDERVEGSPEDAAADASVTPPAQDVASDRPPEADAAKVPRAPGADLGLATTLGLALAAGVGAASLGAIALHRRHPFFFAALYARLSRSKLQEHPVRRHMLDAVRATPGITYGELQRSLGVSNGALSHHLHSLERAKLLRSVADGQLRRFYPPDAGNLQPVPSLGDRALGELRGRGPMTAVELASALGVSRQALRYHTRKHEAAGIIEERDGKLTLRETARS